MMHPWVTNIGHLIEDLQAQLTDLSAQRADLVTQLAGATKALDTPEDQWGVKVWTTDGESIHWRVESRYALHGVISKWDLQFDGVPADVRALHLGRKAGGQVAAAVADKVGESLYAALKKHGVVDWAKTRP